MLPEQKSLWSGEIATPPPTLGRDKMSRARPQEFTLRATWGNVQSAEIT